MNRFFKSLYYSLFRPKQVVLLDYAVQPAPLYTTTNPHPQLLQLIEQNKQQYALLLEQALTLKTIFTGISTNQQQTANPYWNNDFMPGFDIVLLYTIFTTYKPNLYIEIGSGISTRVAAKAKKEQFVSCKLVCVDPQPRAAIRAIADEWVNEPLQKCSLTLFDRLEENDILFFDGSHLLHANSDVQWFFLEVLPRLKKGVLVQVHDVYLPYDYPQNMCSRFYAEQYLLATALLSNPNKFELVAPAFYMSKDEGLQQMMFPLWNALPPGVETHGGSFWFRVQ